MKKNFTLLIADRNPYVRTFLQREMTAAGYRVRLADTGREVLKRAFQGEPLDLIILDLDLPDADEAHVLEHLLNSRRKRTTSVWASRVRPKKVYQGVASTNHGSQSHPQSRHEGHGYG